MDLLTWAIIALIVAVVGRSPGVYRHRPRRSDSCALFLFGIFLIIAVILFLLVLLGMRNRHLTRGEMGGIPSVGQLHLKATPLAQLAGNVDIARRGPARFVGQWPAPAPAPRCSGALLIHPVEAFKKYGANPLPECRCRCLRSQSRRWRAPCDRLTLTQPPAGVYLQAFESKFAMACRSRSGSAFTQTP